MQNVSSKRGENVDFFNPSTLEGSLTIGIIAGLISGAVIGFFSGRVYEKNSIVKSNIKQKGNGNVAIQNSKVGRNVYVREEKDNTEG